MNCFPLYAPPCPSECPEVIAYLPSNGNLTGIGVLDSFDGVTNQGVYRGIVGDAYITATLDAANNSIVLTFDPSSLVGTQATEGAIGEAEIATQAEVTAGVDDLRFITPLKLATRVATTTLAGIIEIATVPEALAGSDNTRAITPASLDQVLGDNKFTMTFANAAARASAVPEFNGQVGVQTDTEQTYTSTGTLAGNWQQSDIQPNTTTTFTANTAFNTAGAVTFELQYGGSAMFQTSSTGISILNGFSVNVGAFSQFALAANASLSLDAASILEITGVAIPALSVVTTGAVAGNPTSRSLSDFFLLDATNTINASTILNINGSDVTIKDGATDMVAFTATESHFSTNVFFEGSASIFIETGTTLDFDTTATIAVNSVNIPANSVLITSGTAGRPSSKLINTFLSTSNTSIWAAPTGLTSKATFDPATATLPEIGQRLAALINDLIANLKPNLT